MKRLLLTLATTASLGASGSVFGAPLFMDDFNDAVDSAANYTQVQTSADTAVTYAFNYSTLNIPVAPNTTDNTTLGVKFEANIADPASVEAVTLHTVAQYSGRYRVKFDAWINANGPFPLGGAGSTEFLTAGVGGDGATVNRGGSTGSGAWTAVDGEGGSANRDFRMYKGASEQFPASGQYAAGLDASDNDNLDPYYAGFGSIDVGALGQGGPNQTGTTAAGTIGFAWHEVELVVDPTGGTNDATSVSWYIDGLLIGTLDAGIGSSFSTDGSVTIGYQDIFSSVSDNATYSFGLIDNLMVIPEPSSFVLVGLGLLGLWGVARRK